MTHKKRGTKKKKVSKKIGKPMATTPSPVDLTQKPVSEFTYDQIIEASSIMNSSRAMWQISELLQQINRGYKFNKYEIAAMNELIEIFNTTFNSPLAQSMKEE